MRNYNYKGILKQLGISLISGLLFIFLVFWYISGTPLGMIRFFFTYYVSSHYFMESPSKEQLFEGSLKGIVKSLGEQHSYYLDETMYKDLMAHTSGTYSGVGIVIGKGPQGIVVESPIEGQPADKAGIVSGDIIKAIDGERTDTLSLEAASKKMRGEPQTTVTLTIEHEGVERDVTLTREQIQLPTVKGKMLTSDIGYIRITQFAETSGQDFGEEYNKLRNQGMKKLILDLRDNPGGLLTTAQEIGNYLLPKGPIVTVQSRTGKLDSYESSGDYPQLPLVVLINKGSASASEIIAGAVQDEGVGTIVGTTSYGKGTVQSVIPDFGDGAIKITIARYHTPKDRIIDGIGIVPDIVVEGSKDKNSPDEQLNKALDILKN